MKFIFEEYFIYECCYRIRLKVLLQLFYLKTKITSTTYDTSIGIQSLIKNIIFFKLKSDIAHNLIKIRNETNRQKIIRLPIQIRDGGRQRSRQKFTLTSIC